MRLGTKSIIIAVLLLLMTASPARAAGVGGSSGSNGETGKVSATADEDDSRPDSDEPTEPSGEPAGATPRGSGSGGGGGNPGRAAPAGPPRHPGLTYDECVDFLSFTEDRSACQPAAPVPPGELGAPAGAPPAAPPVIDLGTIARSVRNEVPVEMPRPHTSPPEGGFQLTGVPTWFWVAPDDWAPVSVRAEIPGVWVEVVATPVEAVWEPGDGSPAVTCAGPARRHPGTAGATTDCGHTYTAVGAVTLTVTVTFAVTWEASTGEGGTLDPIALTTQLPLEVQQRQVVIDG